jgi:hypothetical protein
MQEFSIVLGIKMRIYTPVCEHPRDFYKNSPGTPSAFNSVNNATTVCRIILRTAATDMMKLTLNLKCNCKTRDLTFNVFPTVFVYTNTLMLYILPAL